MTGDAKELPPTGNPNRRVIVTQGWRGGQIIFTRCRVAANLQVMSQTAISVTEAAKNFLSVVEEVERKGEPAVLTREGRPVATLNPVPGVAQTCAELAARWRELEKLPVDEASAFADDLELGRATLPSVQPAWD
jgi:antitoxin (DNA-binding transcriptional repressor) of toxin-antitoxin stability system